MSELTTAVEQHGGLVTGIDVTESGSARMTVDLTCATSGDAHAQEIVASLREVPGVEVDRVSDRTFLMHLGGKLRIEPTAPIRNRDDLSMVYTPGVARVCEAIAARPEDARRLTIKRNTIAVVTDGTAVLGLGDIGPLASLPVMEGKAALFKRFAGIDAFPVALDTTDVDEIVRTVKAIAPVFAGINLEDISAPRCFEIEQRLDQELDIPIFHDDQHGTAIVLTAGIRNACALTGRRLEDLRVVISGAGAAGIACCKMLLGAGVTDIILLDSKGVIHPDREGGLHPVKQEIAEITNPRRITDREQAFEGASVFIGLSRGKVGEDLLVRMADKPFLFSLANPDPEILPELAAKYASVVATGRSDLPNQINNVLAFPGIFEGALKAQATAITPAMKLAASEAIASIVGEDLATDYIIPSALDTRVAPAVAAAVERAAAAQ